MKNFRRDLGVLIVLLVIGLVFILVGIGQAQQNGPTVRKNLPEGFTDTGPGGYDYGVTEQGLFVINTSVELLMNKLRGVGFGVVINDQCTRANTCDKAWMNFEPKYERMMRQVLAVKGVTDFASNVQLILVRKAVRADWKALTPKIIAIVDQTLGVKPVPVKKE